MRREMTRGSLHLRPTKARKEPGQALPNRGISHGLATITCSAVCIEAAMLQTVHLPLGQAEFPNREKVAQSVSQSAQLDFVTAVAAEPLVRERADFADDRRIDQPVISLTRAAPQHAIGSVYT